MDSSTLPSIIYPPPDIKGIIDKTAEYVAQSGPILEQRVRETEKNNSKFSFLNQNDPYHLYYQTQLTNFKTGQVSESIKLDDKNAKEQDNVLDNTPIEPEPFYFSFPSSVLSAQDLDIIKLSAQFVAINGRAFMSSILQREQRNSQFDFLRPSHRLFPYFINLVEQYSKILNPPKDLLNRLESNIKENLNILERLRIRKDYLEYFFSESEKQNQLRDKEKEEYYSIDWHTFVVVGTLEISDSDFNSDLPPPIRLQDLQSMSLVDKSTTEIPSTTIKTMNPTQIQNPSTLDDESESDVEMEDDDDFDEDASQAIQLKDDSNNAPLKMPILDSSAPIKIKSNHIPNLIVNKQIDDFWLCPVCNEKVSVAEVDEHIRIETLDPKRKEQLESYKRKIHDSNLVSSTTDIAKYLKKISSNRSDIFGDQNTSNSNVSNDDDDDDDETKDKRTPIMWDGYSASAEETARRAALGVSTEDQIAAIHRRKGLISDPNIEKIGPQLSYSNQQIQPPLNSAIPPFQPPLNNPNTFINPMAYPQTNFYHNNLQYQYLSNGQPSTIDTNNNEIQSSSTIAYPNNSSNLNSQYNSNSTSYPNISSDQSTVTPNLKREFIDTQADNTDPLNNANDTLKKSKINISDSEVDNNINVPLSQNDNIFDPSSGLVLEKYWLNAYPSDFNLSIDMSGLPTDLLSSDINPEIHLVLKVSPSMLISTLKSQISDVTGLATGKQKLSVVKMYSFDPPSNLSSNSVGSVLKNTASISFYNLAEGCSLALTLRERGGRK
ncbi:Splicing factor 3A subunit 1 [Smittium culicis]|uniref:Splicing factor 3A subunit 1 n=1 Tax=Smittium culicis TaxID=133412 RepID=A0A1R1Y2A6_9FUNG|nr:Splicing factor 3A subunit 1 [Smittium culicis]